MTHHYRYWSWLVMTWLHAEPPKLPTFNFMHDRMSRHPHGNGGAYSAKIPSRSEDLLHKSAELPVAELPGQTLAQKFLHEIRDKTQSDIGVEGKHDFQSRVSMVFWFAFILITLFSVRPKSLSTQRDECFHSCLPNFLRGQQEIGSPSTKIPLDV